MDIIPDVSARMQITELFHSHQLLMMSEVSPFPSPSLWFLLYLSFLFVVVLSGIHVLFAWLDLDINSDQFSVTPLGIFSCCLLAFSVADENSAVSL